MNSWEQCFVERFIEKRKRERYLGFLSNPKRRAKFIFDLNGGLEFDPLVASDVPHSERTKQGLTALLRARGASSNKHTSWPSNMNWMAATCRSTRPSTRSFRVAGVSLLSVPQSPSRSTRLRIRAP